MNFKANLKKTILSLIISIIINIIWDFFVYGGIKYKLGAKAPSFCEYLIADIYMLIASIAISFIAIYIILSLFENKASNAKRKSKNKS